MILGSSSATQNDSLSSDIRHPRRRPASTTTVIRWGSEQGRQVLTHVFTFLSLHDVPSVRLTSVAWWRASYAREIWMHIAASFSSNQRVTSSSSSLTSAVFGVRDVEAVLKQVVIAQKQESNTKVRSSSTTEAALLSSSTIGRAYPELTNGSEWRNNSNRADETTAVNGTSSNNNTDEESSSLPSWLPAGSQLPSWVPQPPPRRSILNTENNNDHNNNKERSSDQIQFREITRARQQLRELEANQTSSSEPGAASSTRTNAATTSSPSHVRSLKEQLDEIAIQVLAKLHFPANTPHSSLLPWQRGEILETQINALRYRAKQLLSKTVASAVDGAGENNNNTITTRNSHQTSIDLRVDLLEKRQKETKQLAINTKIENDNVEKLVKEARRTFKVIELQNAQRNLVREFEKKVVGYCTRFSSSSSNKDSSNIPGHQKNSSSCSHLSTFFDLEMACLAPARIGTKLYTNWSAMKRALPIDDIYFEAIEVLLSSTSFANVSAVEHVIATDELKITELNPNHDNTNHNNADDRELAQLEQLCDGATLSKRRDFLRLLRKACVECLKRSESSSSSSSSSSSLITTSIREETHSMIIDTMIAFVYSAKMTLDGSFSEEMKTQAVGTNVNEVGQPLTPSLEPKSWKEVLDLVDRAKHYATALFL